MGEVLEFLNKGALVLSMLGAILLFIFMLSAIPLMLGRRLKQTLLGVVGSIATLAAMFPFGLIGGGIVLLLSCGLIVLIARVQRRE